jgi:hypothetical protein
MPGRTKRQDPPPPPNKSDAVNVQQVQPPNNRTQPKNKLTVYLVDVASADHGDKELLMFYYFNSFYSF